MSKLDREPDLDFADVAPELGSGLPDDSGTFRRLSPTRRGQLPKRVDHCGRGIQASRTMQRLLVVGERAEELCRETSRTPTWSRFEVVTARDSHAARASLADGTPDGVVLHRGLVSGHVPALGDLGADVPVVALVENPADGDGALAWGVDAVVARRARESLRAAGARALEVCRALVTAPPERSVVSRGHAVLQESHRRLLARTVEARLGQAMVVHDLRSPLAVLRGVHSELLDGPGTRRVLAIMARALGQLEALVGRLEELHTPTRREASERLDVLEIARAIADEARLTPPARRKDVAVRGRGPVYWSGDRDMLERVLLNLVGNALRHTRTCVEIRVDECGGSLRVAVLDDGPGLPETIRADLFHRYVRDPASGRLGLGLAIVQSAVEQAGGRVRAYNRCELSREAGSRASGACFVVRLPHR